MHTLTLCPDDGILMIWLMLAELPEKFWWKKFSGRMAPNTNVTTGKESVMSNNRYCLPMLCIVVLDRTMR
jgi:hypothetical protein